LIISEEQVKQFMEKGWVRIKAAIPREMALEAQNEIWSILNAKCGISQEKASWHTPFYQLSENYRHGIFGACTTPRLMGAIEELIGNGRLDAGYEQDGVPFGWWPINFSLGSTEDWDVPVGGWHWDGLHFRHYIDSPEQGLLMIVMYSDVEARGGGTLLAEGTHKLVAQFLAQYPDGIEYKDAIPIMNRSNPWLAELTGSYGDVADEDRKEIYTTDQIHSIPTGEDRIQKFMEQDYVDENGVRLRVVEATGEAGDVLLCHPFIYHTGSQNHSGRARIMCNINTPLKEKMRLNRDNDSDHSVLEQSIRQALGMTQSSCS